MNTTTSVQQYRIVSQLLEDQRTVFRLQEIGSTHYVEMTAQDISSNHSLLNMLNSKEAHLIGYVCASENFFNVFSLIQNQ